MALLAQLHLLSTQKPQRKPAYLPSQSQNPAAAVHEGRLKGIEKATSSDKKRVAFKAQLRGADWRLPDFEK